MSDSRVRGADGRWLAGGPSPNPGGRPKKVKDIEDELLQAFGGRIKELVAFMIEGALAGSIDMEQIVACDKVIDRVIGKARQRSEVSGPEGKPLNLSGLTIDDLKALRDIMGKARK